MQKNLFDLLVSSNIVSYWLELNVNAEPMLGETLFPTVREIGTKLEWIKGANNQPVALRLSAYDSKAIRRDNRGIEKYDTEMPFFKESKYIDEKMRQQLNILMQTNNESLINQILSKIFVDEVELIKASHIALERMRMEALTTGEIKLASNGQSYAYDYQVPTKQKVKVKKSWSDVSADIIGDITDYVELMKSKGVKITRAVCNSSVAKHFRSNTAMKNAIYVFANGTVNITQKAAIDYIFAETGVRIVVDDDVYVNENGTAIKYVPDGVFVMFPDGDLGYTHMGVTPEESDLMSSLTAKVSIVDDGIAVTTHEEHDPVNVETKVTMVALPSFERANEVMIVNTVANPASL